MSYPYFIYVNVVNERFPPGIGPPLNSTGQRTFEYLVPVHNPLTYVTFEGWVQEPWRNHTQMQLILGEALNDALKRRDADPTATLAPESHYYWDLQGKAEQEIYLEPFEPEPSTVPDGKRKRTMNELTGVTWNVLVNVFLAFRKFFEAYPDLTYDYDVFVEDDEVKYYVASGLVGEWPDSNAAGGGHAGTSNDDGEVETA
ncbi:uncharacterized protein KY384_008072 [Bacidia gigantensis]|uniref:uncharacterized protein n=1 Tax=Bacidia gigantensis TaxID=2732470 RepID=UPI001D057B81|nr:uncharacterized protein KY384_008072 [Bacidia gigantensis]KAG8526643.1 hypothetical protein KY384_008072 [Bacidia gigantensis]